MSERVDIIDNLIISVSVFRLLLFILLNFDNLFHSFVETYCNMFIQIGPPNSQFLKSKEKSTWTAKDVADSVLSDKSALVIILCLERLQIHSRV